MQIHIMLKSLILSQTLCISTISQQKSKGIFNFSNQLQDYRLQWSEKRLIGHIVCLKQYLSKFLEYDTHGSAHECRRQVQAPEQSSPRL